MIDLDNESVFFDEILSGCATEEQYRYFREWLKDDVNRRGFDSYRNVWNSVSGYVVDEKELEGALSNYSSYMNKRKGKLFFFRYAAIFAGILFLSIFFLLRNKTKYDDILNYREITPDFFEGLVLTTSDGSAINLTEAGELSESDGTKLIIEDDRGLVYNDANSSGSSLFNTATVPAKEKLFITLSDGSKVWLNSESSIRYPVNFNSDKRVVILSGEGYFEVEKDEGKPFIVVTKNMNIEVLGTSFNISSYRDNDVSSVTLVEGSVKIMNDEMNFIIKPNDHLSYNEITGNFTLEDVVDIDDIIGWRSGEMVLRDVTFTQLIKRLERWYGVRFVEDDIAISDTELFNGRFDKEDVHTAMETISRSTGLRYKIEDNEIFLFK